GALAAQPLPDDLRRALRVRAPVGEVLLGRDREVVVWAARKVPLHVVRQRGEPKRLAGRRIELEQPVPRPHEMVRVPVRLDPGERTLFSRGRTRGSPASPTDGLCGGHALRGLVPGQTRLRTT